MVMLLAVNGEAQATMMDFTYSGSIVTYDVPTTGTYDITDYGAEGGVRIAASPASELKSAEIFLWSVATFSRF